MHGLLERVEMNHLLRIEVVNIDHQRDRIKNYLGVELLGMSMKESY